MKLIMDARVFYRFLSFPNERLYCLPADLMDYSLTAYSLPVKGLRM